MGKRKGSGGNKRDPRNHGSASPPKTGKNLKPILKICDIVLFSKEEYPLAKQDLAPSITDSRKTEIDKVRPEDFGYDPAKQKYPELSIIQEQALFLSVAIPKLRPARIAEKLGYSVYTIYYWRTLPEFKKALREEEEIQMRIFRESGILKRKLERILLSGL